MEKRIIGFRVLLVLLVCFWPKLSVRAEGSLLDSPYVVPYGYLDTDGTYHNYFTISQPLPVDHNRGESSYVYHSYEEYVDSGTKPSYWLPEGTTVFTGIASSLRELNVGEHYYRVDRTGEVPVGRWIVSWEAGHCVHLGNKTHEWMGLSIGDHVCRGAYDSGWLCYCADCGERLLSALVYAPKDRIETVRYVNMDYGYYYICPNPACRHLENEGYAVPHQCKRISPNRYRVIYDGNGANPLPGGGYADVTGYVQDSFHVYDNAGEYRGNVVEPVTHLNLCTFARRSYTFMGWNTKPDGTGEGFGDGAEILNLSEYNYIDADNRPDARGVVVLYAQWKPAESTLCLDPNGGKYDGRSVPTEVKMGYGQSCLADPELVTADPKNKVSYVTNGGESVSPSMVPRLFSGWEQMAPFRGQMRGNTYYFVAPDGNVDTLRARYENGEILLPTPKREGYGFGGWYEDPACETAPVGFGGDPYLVTRDITLYAKWVKLTLWSVENYVDNQKKGAVDLRWAEPDELEKYYKLYRSADGVHFAQVNSADGSTAFAVTERIYSRTKTTKTYEVPSTGFYEITACGAQGEDYGEHPGGLGGQVTARIYLRKGDVLTITIGGQDGSNGGGVAAKYGNGGGATTITCGSELILVAGGGGGASEYADGEAGGKITALRGDGAALGESGSAGGGGGYVGGVAGNVETHRHDADCLIRHVHVEECFREVKKEKICLLMGGYFSAVPNCNHSHYCPTMKRYGLWQYYHYGVTHSACGAGIGGGSCTNDDYGQYFPQGGYYACTECGSKTCGGATETVFSGYTGESSRHTYYVKEKEAICGLDENKRCKYGYEEGEVITASNAYGGSNYVTDRAVFSGASAGVREGDGVVRILPIQIGMADEPEQKGVEASDLVAPSGVEFLEVVPIHQTAVRTSWKEPKDQGTRYWFRCESFDAQTGKKLYDSNVTSNVLVTGVAGYYYVYNDSPVTIVTEENADNQGHLLEKRELTCALSEKLQYLHVAPVDVAGNVGETSHLAITAKEMSHWPVVTDRIEISSVIGGMDYGSVYQCPDSGVIFVNGSGEIPFRLAFDSYVNGYASASYQITDQEFFVDLEEAGRTQVFRTIVPLSSNISLDRSLPVAQFVRSSIGNALITDLSGTGASRCRSGTKNSFWQTFSVTSQFHGRTIVVTPGAAAGEEHSQWEEDVLHSIRFVPDGAPPVILADRDFSALTVINKDTLEEGGLLFTASDDLSGIREFRLKVSNQDNGDSRIYQGDEEGKILVEYDPATHLFDGDVTLELSAWDNVGNMAEVVYGKTEFELKATVIRLLAPHDPSFKRGESGLLRITARGYASEICVEFPKNFQKDSVTLDRIFTYERPQEEVTEEMTFMIPLSLSEEGEYEIVVRAYKRGAVLEERPQLRTIRVTGTILDELRTRLR